MDRNVIVVDFDNGIQCKWIFNQPSTLHQRAREEEEEEEEAS